MSGEPLPCPHCRTAMREVAARARTGYLIVLDQCEGCGGVWCDRWELFPLAAAEAHRLDPVDAESLGAASDKPRTAGRCPRCETELRAFRDPLLPADARIERCPTCEGMWMNRGELRRLKPGDTKTKPAPPDAAQRIAARLGKEPTWSRVSDIDGAFHTLEAPPERPAETSSELWSTSAWIVLQALLRLLLRV
jgi:Zn-finger nucleic acid-binding protein